jgi:DNA-binding LacI/PurR family transcriptional regulator
MGYRRNELARAMVSGKSNVVGLLTSVGGSETVMRIIEGALDEAAARGYITKILRLPYYATLEQVRDGVELCTAWQLDGVVAVGLREDVLACLSREIESNRRPVAYIESFPQGSPEIRVGSDDAGGIRLGLEHLAALGHRSIAFLGGAPESSISQGRRASLRPVFARRWGCRWTGRLVVHSDWGRAAVIEEAALRILNAAPRPTAIFCMSDAAAMVTLRWRGGSGLSLPAQLSVVGYGNAALSAYADPALTTIAQPFGEMGRIAVQRLLAHIHAGADSPEAPAHTHDTPPQKLMVRGSTAPPQE